jgi:hypothetical protein
LCTQPTPPAASAFSVLEKVHSVDPASGSVLDIEPPIGAAHLCM